ncbi:alpha/beta hydrolase [Pseudoalteromonas obscura]|uniref:Alpha/beta fold hydrolase n=1 Tax=Pseudoalteromonas obscura TaxID=3048491 RepID=A0ABT7EP67_9GAMM|nr:alpha/beta fold hydrolase [Pseudoalteromonas sp. P94(2023)]MDK2596808.1 alpha/beta fold hydrolase [Pseudoalteromonas sp. P94(2023)]
MTKNFSVLVFSLLLSGCSFSGIFFPIDNRPDEQNIGRFEAISLTASDGAKIKHYLFKPETEHKATIFAFQGSGSKVVNWYKVIKPLVDDGYQVFMMDYRGFGDSQGTADHSLVAQDASNALTYLVGRSDVSNRPVLVLGQSYGGQVAIYVAHQHSELVDALITEGTFTSFSDEAAYSSPWIVRPLIRAIFTEPYIAADLISDIEIPMLIVHSSNDKIVPFHMAQTLYASANSEKQLWEIRGKHVAGLIDLPQEYISKVNGLLLLSHHKASR